MIKYNMGLMISELIQDEAEILTLYDDKTGKPPVLATGGKITVGVGHNLSDRGISRELSRQWLAADIAEAEHALDVNCPWWRTMSDARQRGLLNMCFNMGWCSKDRKHGLCTFINTLEDLRLGRFHEAAEKCLQSAWAHQVGARAVRIAEKFRDG